MKNRSRQILLIFAVALILCNVSSQSATADGPRDNVTDKVRPIPPLGIEVPAEKLSVLKDRCKLVRSNWQHLLGKKAEAATKTKNKWERAAKEAELARIRSMTPEVLVFPRAVEMAIEFNQFYKEADVNHALQLLELADHRTSTAFQGGTWTDVVGLGDGSKQQLIVGGFKSRIDDSFQPYSVVVPAGFRHGDSRPRRLDLWFHGRGETLSELNFLTAQQKNPGQYTPADTFVLHPYGRYSNAFKFAGEIDVLEALDYVQSRLPVDPNRVAVRGFSMGGAGCWQMAVHYSDRFFAANPGAGFSETPEFLAFFQGEDVARTAPLHQKKLWQWYDCQPWAANLNQCPTVVYSGEIDRQKQAADVMEIALKEVGIDMTHIIGPDTAHKIHSDSKIKVEKLMTSLADAATSKVPDTIHFHTSTLRYHKMHWVDVRGLAQHWVPAAVDASIDEHEIKIETQNVTHLRLNFDAGQWQKHTSGPVHVLIDGDEIVGPIVASDRSLRIDMARSADGWLQTESPDTTLRKRPHLQGPIDDAFMDSFLFVLPSEKSADPVVQKWIEDESSHAMIHWRKHFRGDIRSVTDTELTEEHIAGSNLILFGDVRSNHEIANIVGQLPITWNDREIKIGSHSVPAKSHVPIMVYPNPKNRNRYVVLNSGFTFREYDYLNNARQTSKLPDWALVDVSEGANFRDPGKVKAAGFFDETWQ